MFEENKKNIFYLLLYKNKGIHTIAGENDEMEEKSRERRSKMYKVKVFDKEHEKDLEAAVNDFLSRLKDGQLIDVKYSVAAMESEGEQIYCFSAMVIYRT